MKRFGLYASVLAAIVLGANGVAKAADVSASDSLPKKAPPPAKESTPPTCSGVADFVFTNCQLSWYGITVYGIIDAGVGWQSHGAPFDGTSSVSETCLILLAQLSLSNFGISLSLRAAPPHPRWIFLFSDIRCAGGPLAVAAIAGGAVELGGRNPFAAGAAAPPDSARLTRSL